MAIEIRTTEKRWQELTTDEKLQNRIDVSGSRAKSAGQMGRHTFLGNVHPPHPGTASPERSNQIFKAGTANCDRNTPATT